MQLSLHPAPTSRFPRLGEPWAWGLATPREHCAPNEIEWLWSGWRPAHAYNGTHGWAASRPGSDCRTHFTSLVLASGDAPHARVSRHKTPPSFGVVALGGYYAVGSRTYRCWGLASCHLRSSSQHRHECRRRCRCRPACLSALTGSLKARPAPQALQPSVRAGLHRALPRGARSPGQAMEGLLARSGSGNRGPEQSIGTRSRSSLTFHVALFNLTPSGGPSWQFCERCNAGQARRHAGLFAHQSLLAARLGNCPRRRDNFHPLDHFTPTAEARVKSFRRRGLKKSFAEI